MTTTAHPLPVTQPPATPRQSSPSAALQRARSEITARMGGEEAIRRANRMAAASLYADQARGYSLD